VTIVLLLLLLLLLLFTAGEVAWLFMLLLCILWASSRTDSWSPFEVAALRSSSCWSTLPVWWAGITPNSPPAVLHATLKRQV
jgi:hypothetical protein